MFLPEIKEREYRFRLALRMGLPIFALVLVLISNSLITSYDSLDSSFYIISILLIVFSIYFILYIIYESFDIRITQAQTKTFTREYFYKYIKDEIAKNKEYTLVLISIDNLNDINDRYGIKNGDIVLSEVTLWIYKYFKSKDIVNFPMGHVKGGDFIIGLKGPKNKYLTILELLCLKSDNFTVDEIEVKIVSAINDTYFSKEIDYLVENLFEQQIYNKNEKFIVQNSLDINPNEVESFVTRAIKEKHFSITMQDIFEGEQRVIKECFVKLKISDSKLIYPKTYMKILDKLGLMANFDLMVLEEIIIYCSTQYDKKFAINISPSSLRNPNFLLRAKELINSNDDIKNRVIFLLNEFQYHSQIQRYNSTLQSLRKMGILIAIERLGAIHTSFLYLRDLDIDIVRFDSSYTKNITDENVKSIIDGFNMMAHAKGVKTWLKMIESQDVKEEAQKLKIDYLQGKYLSPVEISKI
ncbi:MAG: GGDEF domain-containing protein [Campylobacterota bacterium]|nr:GGDEF domain-containing protein [Campylobacterota bacterium]